MRKTALGPARALWPLLMVAGLALFPGCGDDGPAGPAARTIDVDVVDFGFQPTSVNARVGDTLRWTQRGAAPHTVTSGDPGSPGAGSLFDLGLEVTGEVEEFTLREAGTISYFCRPHPFMIGSIVVSP